MELTHLSHLATALRLDRAGNPGELVSLVGGGGKTTTLFALGRQLQGPTILTTTTKMGSDQREGVTNLVGPSDDEVASVLEAADQVLVWGGVLDHRAEGVNPTDCDRWYGAVARNVIVEADGSRRRPFKAPAAFEPVIPARTTTLLACIGASALNQPIATACHRPELVAALVGAEVNDLLTPERAARVLLSDQGSQKGLPDGARFVVVVHRVGAEDERALDQLAEALDGNVEVIAVAALEGSDGR